VLKTSVEGRLPLVMQLEVMAPLLQRGTPLSGMGGSAGGDRAQSDWALYRRLDCPVTESHPRRMGFEKGEPEAGPWGVIFLFCG